MTPARLGPIHRDDELLDALGARQEAPVRERDELTALLGSWTRHIDADAVVDSSPVAHGHAARRRGTARPPWRRGARIASAALAATLTFSGGSMAAALVSTHLPVLQQLGTVGTYFLHGVFPSSAQQPPSEPDGEGGLLPGSAGVTHAPRPVEGRQQHSDEQGPRGGAVVPVPSSAPSGASTEPGQAHTPPAESGPETTSGQSGTAPGQESPGAGAPTDVPAAGSAGSAQSPAAGAPGSGATHPAPPASRGQAPTPGTGGGPRETLRTPTAPNDAGTGEQPSPTPPPIVPPPAGRAGDPPGGTPGGQRPVRPPHPERSLPDQAAPRAHQIVPGRGSEGAARARPRPPADPGDAARAHPEQAPAAPTSRGGAPGGGQATTAP
ncbi:MAG TPA: hypothetical protein VFJ12_04175 [Segeticoccus sp.]|nr:hypothetical protein [Segeticoccus sp.]